MIMIMIMITTTTTTTIMTTQKPLGTNTQRTNIDTVRADGPSWSVERAKGGCCFWTLPAASLAT